MKISGNTLIEVKNDDLNKGHFNCPEGITKIGKDAFKYCTKLTSVALPQNLTEIEELAFYACTNLTVIKLPQMLTNISHHAFMACNKLQYIIIDSKDQSGFNRIFNLLSESLRKKIVHQSFINWLLNTNEMLKNDGLVEDLSKSVKQSAFSMGLNFFNKATNSISEKEATNKISDTDSLESNNSARNNYWERVRREAHNLIYGLSPEPSISDFAHDIDNALINTGSKKSIANFVPSNLQPPVEELIRAAIARAVREPNNDKEPSPVGYSLSL